MAHLVSLIARGAALVVACWCLLQPLHALASFPATQTNPDACTVAPCYTYAAASISGGGGSGGGWPTPMAACQKSAQNYNAVGTGYTVTINSADETTCYYFQSGVGSKTVGVSRTPASPATPVYSCPANATLSGSTCTCGSGYVESGNSCVAAPSEAEAYCAAQAGKSVGSSYRSSTAELPENVSVCDPFGSHACGTTQSTDFCGMGSDGVWLCHAKGTFTGSTCTPGPDADPVAPQDPSAGPIAPYPDPPAPGMCPGQVNGVDVVVPCGASSSKSSSSSSGSDSSGSSSSGQTTRETTCAADGSCTTTTTTTTTVNGVTSSKTDTTTQPKGEFCAKTPGAKECGGGEGSSFGGSCQTSFVCAGDAVQCATAKAVNDSLCKFKEVFDMDPSVKAYAESVMAGTESPNPRDNPTVVDLGTFDQSNPLGSSCPADIPVSLSHFSAVIPLSEYCNWFQIIGNMLVIVSLLGATLFVVRGAA